LNERISRPAATQGEEMQALAEAFDRRYKRMNVNQGFNGSTKFVNLMLSVIAALMIAAVCGMWGMYGKVEALTVDVQSLHSLVNLIIDGRMNERERGTK
jgi:hypothetical protein